MALKKRPTISDVANLAGVSIKSISRALNNEPGLSEETRQRIFEAMRQLEYFPNPVVQGIRGTSTVVGLVVGELDDYVNQIVRGISQVAHQLRYSLILHTQDTTDESSEGLLPLVASRLIGGLLMVVPLHYDALADMCKKYEVPHVLIDHYMSNNLEDNVPTITALNRKGVHDAMRYLLALGHRDIGIITGFLTMVSARDRLQGYKDALAEVGIGFDPSLVAEPDENVFDAFKMTQRVLQRDPRPTAIVAWDDLAAIAAMAAIRSEGLEVGLDVSVIGFDDIPVAAMVYPSLTTIRQPMVEMGAAAMDVLVSMLKGVTPQHIHREFPTELIVRQSTSAPRLVTEGVAVLR